MNKKFNLITFLAVAGLSYFQENLYGSNNKLNEAGHAHIGDTENEWKYPEFSNPSQRVRIKIDAVDNNMLSIKDAKEFKDAYESQIRDIIRRVLGGLCRFNNLNKKECIHLITNHLPSRKKLLRTFTKHIRRKL